MKVELLVIPDCPNYPPALARLREVMLAEGVKQEIEEIIVKDKASAEMLKFPGSPTIRINGNDVEVSTVSQNCAVSCRMYASDAEGLTGVPSVELIRSAIRVASA